MIHYTTAGLPMPFCGTTVKGETTRNLKEVTCPECRKCLGNLDTEEKPEPKKDGN